MARFHIGKSGKSAACNARIGHCPLGGDDEHFKTREEANKAAEKKMGEEFNTTSSTKKSPQKKKSSRSTQKSNFSIPEGKTGEGYMGGRYWEGGNLIRMTEERKAKGESYPYISNKDIAGELRNDIKKAVKSGYLPTEINGHKVKYSVATEGTNAIRITAKSDATMLELSEVDTSNSPYAWNAGEYISTRKGNAETAELQSKLEEMQNSYRYDGSNSQFDYFDTNFYGKVNIEGKGDFSDVEKASNKLNRALVEAAKEGQIDLSNHSGPEYDGGDKLVDEAIQKNPKVRQAFIEYKTANEHYKAYKEINNMVYDTNKELQREANKIGDHPYDKINQRISDIKREKDRVSRFTNSRVDRIAANTNENSKMTDIVDSDSYEHKSIRRKFQSSLERAGLVKKSFRARRFRL